MMTVSEIRQSFLDFFREKQHHIVPSAPIVVKNDPTLMFTNAGMNQFKDFFLGNRKPEYPRVADTQKCLRVSGKHNDLEEVGLDHYHHTMFEMLGNWSFGDPAHPERGYFKEEAIAWAWELLTNRFQLPEEQLYVTVFEGDEKDGLPKDKEALLCWKKHIAEDHILFGNKKDNFWEMGDTGPCGPCSEIHFDGRSPEQRNKVDGKNLINADNPEVIEIWNLVFMEFNRLKDSSLSRLPAKHVDTGMGLERLVHVLQHKDSNYDTDLFIPVIHETEKITGEQYKGSNGNTDVAFRVIADHIRAICFTIADGQLPSNTGAGYVIRRILRRAVRYYYSYLNYKSSLLYQLVPGLAAQFEAVFPELLQQVDFVAKVVREEEESFLRTLDRGLKKIDEMVHDKKSDTLITGKEAFELYDTFGFPVDLTRLIARENHLSVDEKGFKAEMQQQKERSRQATTVDTADWILVHDVPETTFVGYDDLLTETRVVKYRKVKSKSKEQYQLVLENTPFYAESGGQVGDVGILKIGGKELPVVDTKKENDLILHVVEHVADDMTQKVIAKVDFEKRLQTMYNHTATHLLHAALKEVLGRHVNQKGSLVSPEILRFDVSHFAKITDEELRKVEFLVNEKIRENIPIVIKEMPKDEAMQLGAMALFGEKYGDVVRVVTIDPQFSLELCGGTHVTRTGMIGVFTITSESAVAAGVRRIEALTGSAALRYVADKVKQNKALSALLKSKDPVKTIEKLLADKTALEKRVAALEAKELAQVSKNLAEKTEQIKGVNFLGQQIEVDSAQALKKVCFDLKPYLTNYLVVLTANISGKAGVAILIDENVANEKALDAGKIIKQHIAPLIKGGGGGQKTLAIAGGQETGKLQEVIMVVKQLL